MVNRFWSHDFLDRQENLVDLIITNFYNPVFWIPNHWKEEHQYSTPFSPNISPFCEFSWRYLGWLFLQGSTCIHQWGNCRWYTVSCERWLVFGFFGWSVCFFFSGLKLKNSLFWVGRHLTISMPSPKGRLFSCLVAGRWLSVLPLKWQYGRTDGFLDVDFSHVAKFIFFLQELKLYKNLLNWETLEWIAFYFQSPTIWELVCSGIILDSFCGPKSLPNFDCARFPLTRKMTDVLFCLALFRGTS